MAKRTKYGYIVPFQWSGGGHDTRIFGSSKDANTFATKKHRGKKVTGKPFYGGESYL